VKSPPGWTSTRTGARRASPSTRPGSTPANRGGWCECATAVEKGTAAPAENTIAGYWVIETADIETATNLAARLPTANYGYVEVRQVVELEG
jgi:hypothetical protein